MLVLITGATGFVGQHLVERLLAEGHSCRALVRPDTDAGDLQARGVAVTRGSLADDHALREATRGADAVVHLAGSRGARSEAEMLEINARGTGRLAAAALAESPALRRFVYVSTVAATAQAAEGSRGPRRGHTRPRTALARRLSASADLFGRSKRAGEQRLLELSERLPVTILRVPRVYGPGDRTWLPMARAAKRHVVPLPRGGSQALRLVYVEDLCDAIALALTRPHPSGKVLYVGSGQQITLQELKRALEGALGVHARALPLPRWIYALRRRGGLLTGDRQPLGALPLTAPTTTALGRCQGCSPQEAQAAFGWTPRTPLAEGLRTTLAWYRSEGWL